MPENSGLYKKYEVRRLDGKPLAGPVFVLDLGSDTVHAYNALSEYAESCRDDLPALSTALGELAREVATGRTDGPMHQALRMPREG